MNATYSQESDSHPSTDRISLKEQAVYLLQLGCFWLVLATYLFPVCKQKLNQAIGR